MKILITGSTGFIGSYFINIYKKVYNVKTFSFLNNDLTTLDCNGVDTILHLSALVHQMKSARPEEYERINVIQTLQIAKKAKESGVKHFIFMSTVKVYGEENDTIYTEDTPCNPQDNYGISKLYAEKELQKLQSESFIVSIIRTPIVYGKNVKGNIRSLITLIKKISILPFAKTNNQRSMVYIGNLCALINTIVNQKQSGVFLASDDTPLSTTELIQKIAFSLGITIYLIHIPFFDYLLKKLKPSLHQRLFGNFVVDNTKTKQILNFHNPYSSEEGIKNMIKGNL